MSSERPVVCSLETGADMEHRLAEWQSLLARATTRAETSDGVRVEFPPEPDVAAEAGRLAALEAACCAWMDFVVHIENDRTTFDVRAPAEARDLVVKLFGP
jgi:hypothetical protein